MNKPECRMGPRIWPEAIKGDMTVSELVDGAFMAYNAARLREACRLFAEKILEPDVTVGLSIAGALTPGGLGMAALVPLVRSGFVDWISSTGANLYHDVHFALNQPLHMGTPHTDDKALKECRIVRIYDVLFDYEVLVDTDIFLQKVLQSDVFRGKMGTAELHHHLGRFLSERRKALGLGDVSLLAAAYESGVPVYTPSPGDSSIGLNAALLSLAGNEMELDVYRDVNETAAIVFDARKNGKSAVVIMGGGSPKNFLLQTEPHIQEIMKLEETGHDYFIQVTDARPDTGGLSGATPSEAVTWGKINADLLPDSVVCYTDVTIALPIITAYAMSKREPRPLKRLYDRREELLERLKKVFLGPGGGVERLGTA